MVLTPTRKISADTTEKFLTAVRTNVGLIVADGSYKSGRSSAAIVIQHKKMTSIKN